MIALSFPEPDKPFGWSVCSTNVRRELFGRYEDASGETDLPILHCIRGVDMLPCDFGNRSKARNVGYAFIEDSLLVKHFVGTANSLYDHVCAGSTWCEKILREAGVKSVSTVIQGVNTELFKPDPYSHGDEDPQYFRIFTGGKAEFRKGTDIAMKAIGIMMERHKDVLAVAAWHNPWPATQATLKASPLVPYSDDLYAMAKDAGMDLSRLEGPVEKQMNQQDMLALYGYSTIGLFPNRCEAGTNLPMMELMACGKPVIATDAHGHEDVLGFSPEEFCLPSNKFTYEVSGQATAEWYEPPLDAVIEALEFAYQKRGEAYLPREGAINRQAMKLLPWSKTARELERITLNE